MNLSGNNDSLDSTSTYHVSKLEFFFEYVASSAVSVPRCGFVRPLPVHASGNDGREELQNIDDRRHFAYCDDTNEIAVCNRRGAPLTARSLEPDALLYAPRVAENALDDAPRLVRQLWSNSVLSDALCVRVQYDEKIQRTRVQFYWHCWQNRNRLDADFARWLLSALDADANERLQSLLRCGGPRPFVSLAVARRGRAPSESDFCCEELVTLLDGGDCAPPTRQFYVFSFDRAHFVQARARQRSQQLQAVLQNGSAAVPTAEQTFPQCDSHTVYRLDANWRSAEKQYRFCALIATIARHLNFAVSCCAAEPRNVAPSAIDVACFLHMRRRQQINQDVLENEPTVGTVNIGNCGWIYDAKNDCLRKSECDSSSARCTFPLSVTFDAEETPLFFDVPPKESWRRVQWVTDNVANAKAPCVPTQNASPLTIMNRTADCSARVGALAFAIDEAGDSQGQSPLARAARVARTPRDESGYAYFERLWGTRSAPLRTFFDLFVSDQFKRQRPLPDNVCFPTRATLVLCDLCDLWRWLAALAKLPHVASDADDDDNERNNESDDSRQYCVAQSTAARRRNVYHCIDKDTFAVRARVHCVATLEDYKNLTFADVLLCDVLIVTYDALVQLNVDTCSYMSEFAFDDQSAPPFASDEWLRCMRHSVNALGARSLRSVCRRRRSRQTHLATAECGASVSVPLEAIAWLNVVVDSPWSDLAGERKPMHTAFEQTAKQSATERFLCALWSLAFPHTVLLCHDAAPSLAACNRSPTVLSALRHNIGITCAGRRDFMQQCTLRVADSSIGKVRERRLFVAVDTEHAASLCDAQMLMLQLQDLQALQSSAQNQDRAQPIELGDLQHQNFVLRHVESGTVGADGDCEKTIYALKPSYRYLLHYFEHNASVGAILRRSLCEQILQRAARFLSQINHQYARATHENEHDALLREHEQIEERAGDAFHAMVRYRQQLLSNEVLGIDFAADSLPPSESTEIDTSGGSGGADEHRSNGSDTSGSSSSDSEYFDTGSAPSDISLDDSDDEFASGDSGSIELNEAALERSPTPSVTVTRQRERIDRAVRAGDHELLQALVFASSSALSRRARRASQRWQRNWLQRFRGYSDLDTVRAKVSNFVEFTNSNERTLLAEYDSETGVGWSSLLAHRVLLQRVEILNGVANETRSLPYQTCITSVRDRQLISFVNLLATSLDLRPHGATRVADEDSGRSDEDEAIDAQNDEPIGDAEQQPLTQFGFRWRPRTLAINHYRPLYESFAASSIRTMSTLSVEQRRDVDGEQRLPRAAEFVDRGNAQTQSELAAALTNLRSVAALRGRRRRRDESHIRREWRKASDRVERNQVRLLLHYDATETSLERERAQTRALLCAQIRVIVRTLVHHPQNPLQTALLNAPGVLRQLLSNDRVNEQDIDEEEARDMYNFFCAHVKRALQPTTVICANPPLSANYSYLVEQIEKFYCNTRWLDRDLEFVRAQAHRVRANRDTLRNTLRQMVQATTNANDNSDTGDDAGDASNDTSDSGDSFFECVACTESVRRRDICLFACGHWCCWPCFEQGGNAHYRVEEDGDPYVSAAQPGKRCFHCRYIEQSGESAVRVRQTSRALPDPAHASAANTVTLEPPQDSPAKQSTRNVSTAATSNCTGDEKQNDDLALPAPSVYAKTDAIVRTIQRTIDRPGPTGDDTICKIAVFSQYATQLHEIYEKLRKWTRIRGSVDVYFNPLPSFLVQEQSRQCDWSRAIDSATALLDEGLAASDNDQTRKRKRDQGNRTEQNSSAVPRVRTRALSSSGQRRHIVVLQHIDLTRDTGATRDASMFRCAPPLFGMTHALFVETFCVRLTNDANAVERTAELEKRLLRECCAWAACANYPVHRPLELIRFQLKRNVLGTEQMLRDAIAKL